MHQEKNGRKENFIFSDNPFRCKKGNDREIGFHFFLILLRAFSHFSLENGAAKYEFKSRNKY